MIPNLPDYARLIKERVGLHFDNAMEDLLKSALSRRMASEKSRITMNTMNNCVFRRLSSIASLR